MIPSLLYSGNIQILLVLVNWKLTNVPICKNGKKEDPGNYRTVSVSSVPGKIVEKIILGVTEKYLRDNSH